MVGPNELLTGETLDKARAAIKLQFAKEIIATYNVLDPVQFQAASERVVEVALGIERAETGRELLEVVLGDEDSDGVALSVAYPYINALSDALI